MRSRLLAVVWVVWLLAPLSAQAPDSGRQRWNFIDRLGLPASQQDAMTTQVLERLATGVVKTASDARSRPFGPARPGGAGGRFLSGDELQEVTGLFFVETGVLKIDGLSPRLRDLVWEVTVFSGIGSVVRDVFLVSVQSGVVTQIFPPASLRN